MSRRCDRPCCRAIEVAKERIPTAGRLSPYEFERMGKYAAGETGLAFFGAGRFVLLANLPKRWAKTEPTAPPPVEPLRLNPDFFKGKGDSS